MAIDPNDEAALAARERVLAQFMNDHPLPMMEDVEAWVRRYPDYANEFAECAEMLAHSALALLSPTVAVMDPQDEVAISKAVHRAMGDRYPGRSATLADHVRAANVSVDRLAERVDIDNGILTGLLTGRVDPPRGDALLTALAPELGKTPAELRLAANATERRPALLLARAPSAPRRHSIPFAEAVAASKMSPERKAYWLQGE